MVMSIRTMCLPVTLRSPVVGVRNMVEFVILDLPSLAYNIILGRPFLHAFLAVMSTYYLKMKLPMGDRVGEMYASQRSLKEYNVKAISNNDKGGLVWKNGEEENRASKWESRSRLYKERQSL